MSEKESPDTGSGRPATRRGWDRSTRSAALIAALVALPVTVAVAGFAIASVAPEEPVSQASPTATATPPQPTTPVRMSAAPLAERPATVCRALLSQLPSAVRDLPQRPVTAGAEQNAAYGDPALTVECGVGEPSFPPTDTVWVVEQVCWHAREQGDATVLTTVDREEAVRVTVPKAYDQPLQWVAPVSEAIVASILTAGDVPTGCRR